MRPTFIAVLLGMLAAPPLAAGTAPDGIDPAAYLDLLRLQVDGLDTVLDLPAEPDVYACDPADTPATRGLFIGAAEWTQDPDYHLKGPVNDAELMRNALVARGASAENLTVLAGPQATRQGVSAAAAALLGQTGCGDSVVLHASGWIFSAAQLAPTTDTRGPFVFGETEVTLGAMVGLDLGINPARPVADMGPYLLLNQDSPAVSDVLNADALSDLVTRLRNRGADVTVVLDTSTAEEMRLEDRQSRVDPYAQWRTRMVPGNVAAPNTSLMLQAQAGALTVYYGTAVGEMTVEMNLPRDAAERRFYGAFSFRMASAILKAERTTPTALARGLGAEDKDGQIDRTWTYVFSTTDPERDLLVESRPTTAPLDTANLTLRGKVDAVADTMIVTINGQIATSAADGSFSQDIALQAGVNRFDILAMTRDNQPITHSFELYYEGDIQALLGTGSRFALIIANQDYAEGSGLPDLATPKGDAEALAQILRSKYGFMTEATAPDGSTQSLMLTDATRLDIETALFGLSQVAGERDTVLIFYAGHGLYEAATDGAYWMPSDARAGLPFSYLPAAAITDAILRINAGKVLVISDSCYSGALLRGGPDTAAEDARGKDRLLALQRIAAKRSRIVIASGGNEPVADGGGDGHSVFARALLTGLEQIGEDAFTGRELFDGYLLPLVVGKAAQEPQYRPMDRAGHEGGDIVFTRSKG
jgi:hypothetical protein